MKMRTILLFSFAMFIGVSTSLLLCGRSLVLERMVTKQVLEKIVSELAEDLTEREHSYTRFYGLTWTVGSYARTLVYRSEQAKRNLKEPSEFTRLYKDIIQVARETLRTPEGLKVIYLLHKPDAIALVQKYGITEAVKQELQEMLPYFDGSLDPEIAQRCEERRQAWQAMERDVQDYDSYAKLVDSLRENFGLTNRNFNYYEWPLRRKAEGGQELVNAWALAIADFAAAL